MFIWQVVGLSAQQQILGVFSHSIVSCSYCPLNGGYLEVL